MQFKPITPIIVLFLVVACLLVSGCTTNTTNQTTSATPSVTPSVHSDKNQANEVSTAYPTAGKSELLQGIVAYDNSTVGNGFWNNYKVTWINNTAVRIEGTYEISTYNFLYLHFPTVTAASAYFDSKRPDYPVKSAAVASNLLYHHVIDQNATVMKSVQRYGTTGTDSVTYTLEQLDALVVVSSAGSQNKNQA